MNKNKEKKELQTRREFFKTASRILPVLVLSAMPVTKILGKVKHTPDCSCTDRCEHSCQDGCTNSCQQKCSNSCYNTCRTTCREGCGETCGGSCKGNCVGSC